jgi:predicted CXXCH cytochrome family protein
MFSHPVNISSARRSDLLPLQDGRITCATCHDTDALRGHEDLPSRDDPRIRADLPIPTLCSECHESGLPGSANSHAAGLGLAHLKVEKHTNRVAPTASSLDPESRACMACHDGTAASDAGSHAVAKSAFKPGQDHPIGVPYKARRPAGAGGDEIRLVEVNSLDKRIRLFDGQIGCGSCHSAYSKQSKLLVMTTLRSKLCFGCHIE